MNNKDLKLASWITTNRNGSLICALRANFVHALIRETQFLQPMVFKSNTPTMIKNELHRIVDNVLTDYGLYNGLIINKEALTGKVGLPAIFDCFCDVRKGYTDVVVNYLISSINAGKIKAHITSWCEIKGLIVAPVLVLDISDLAMALDSDDVRKAQRVTRAYDRFPNNLKMDMQEAIKKNVAGHYVPDGHFLESVTHQIQPTKIIYGS